MYCKHDDSKFIGQKSEENKKIYFIQFQVIVEDEDQKFIRILQGDSKEIEIQLQYSKEKFLIGGVKIPFAGIGTWQYVFINSTIHDSNIMWYSNFKLLMNESYISNIHGVQLLQENHIRMEFLYINDIQNFVEQCHQQQKITLKIDPQLSQIRFGNFNNNLFIISFWVNFLNNYETLNIYICKKYDFRYVNDIIDYYVINLNRNEINIFLELEFQIQLHFLTVGWTFFTSEFNSYDQYNIIKCHNKLQSIEEKLKITKFVQFQSQLGLKITKPIKLLLTQIQFNLDYFDDTYCIPGCKVCSDIICLECNQDLILENGSCTCTKVIYFSLNECFFPDLDIYNQTIQITQQNCPKFDEQICQECHYQRNMWNPSYCQYSQSDYYISRNYEFPNYNQIMVVFYLKEDEIYIIDQYMTLQKKDLLYAQGYNNVLLLHSSKYLIYQQGIYTNSEEKKVQCQQNYFGKFCQPKIKKCQIQRTIKICQQCKDSYYNNQQKCKRCPFNCERCFFDLDYKIKCIKCSDNYFLKLNYKCERCKIQYCSICYEYDKYQMSLQEFEFIKNNEIKEIGCAECNLPYVINLETRSCQLENFQFELQQEECQIQNCLYCQLNTCIFCSPPFFNYLHTCIYLILEIDPVYKKMKQNLLYNNYWKIFALYTFLYYNYDYSHIIKDQKNIMILDCDFPLLHDVYDMIDCLDRNQSSFGGFSNQLYTFIKFNISLQDNHPQLLNYNSIFDFDENLKETQLTDGHQQILDLTFDSNYNFSFWDQKKIFSYSLNMRIRMNYTFQNDHCISIESNILIINNSYIKVGNFCIEIVGDYPELLEIRNTIFEGANQSAKVNVLGNNYKFSKFTMENVTFKNFQSESFIQFRLQAQSVVFNQLYFHNIQSAIYFHLEMQNIKLSYLQISNDEQQKTQFSFIIYSQYQHSTLEFQSIKIINCIIENNIIFNSQSMFFNNDFTFIDVQIYSSMFYQSQFLNLKAGQIQIRNFKIINCTLDGSQGLLSIEALNVLIYNLSFIDIDIFINPCLIVIYIQSNKQQKQSTLFQENGICEINSLKIDNNKFHNEDREHPIVDVNTINFVLNNLIISNCYIKNMLFSIQFDLFANISNVDIYSITNNEILSKHELFQIQGETLYIQQFSLRNCIQQNHLFNINDVTRITINTTFIQNIVISRNYELYFIFLNSDYISIEYLTIIHLTDMNQFINLGQSLLGINAQNQVIIKNVSITKVQSSQQTFIIIKTNQLAIINFKIDQVNQISNLLDITSQKVRIINATFQQQNIGKLFHFLNVDYVWLLDIIINEKIINSIFEFHNCNHLLLENIHVYPGLKIQNIVQLKQKISQGSILIQNVYFNLVGSDEIQSLILNNERIIVLNLTIRGLRADQLQFKGQQIYIVNFTILDSWIDVIKIEIMERDLFFTKSLIRGIFYINHVWFTVHNSQSLSQLPKYTPFIELQSPNHIFVFYHIKIINNHNLPSKFIKFDSKIKQLLSEIILINNECTNNCQDYYGNDNYSNYLFGNKLKYDGTNKKSQKNAIMIKINNKQIRQGFLYVPSGQSLKDYQIFDSKYGQSHHYVKKIEIINMVNDQEQRLIGNFNISAFKYQIQDKIILNQTENILNFNNFTQTKDYNQLIELKITNNPYQNETFVQLVIQYDDSKYERLSLLIKTFICQIGEIFRQDMCLKCDTIYQLYSLRQNSNLCSVFDSQIGTDFKHNSIKLREGYWRPFMYSHIIEKCIGKYDRCIGGWQTGNNLCKIGHFGGLCDSCDTNNILGQGYYQMIDNQCKICDNYFKNGQFLIIKLLIIIIIYQAKLYLKSQSNQGLYTKYLLSKLIFHQHFQVINIYFIDLSAIILDILIQNISITQQVLKNQDFNLPDFLGIFTNPIQLISNSTFCFSQYFGLEQYQVTLIFSFLFPFVIYNTFISLSYVTNGFQVRKQYVFIQPMINLFILLGPNLLAQFTANLFYVEYSKQRYVLSDLGVRYFTKSHLQLIKYFLSPVIISFGLIIPLVLGNQINQLTKRLFKKQIFQTFGSLIIQYNVKFELIIRYYLTSLLLSLFQINPINMLITPKDLILVLVSIFAIKKTYKIKKFNKILLKSWIFIGLVTYLNQIEQQVIDQFYIQMCASSFIIIYIISKYIRQLLFAYDKQIYGFIQSRRRLSSYFISKILYNEKQYWKLISQLVKLHKLKFVSFKQQSEKIILQTVLKQNGQNYQNLPTLKTEANEGIEMQQF